MNFNRQRRDGAAAPGQRRQTRYTEFDRPKPRAARAGGGSRKGPPGRQPGSHGDGAPEGRPKRSAIILRIVEVQGETVTIELAQRAENAWSAAGEFKGEQIRTRGATQEDAVATWVGLAAYLAGR